MTEVAADLRAAVLRRSADLRRQKESLTLKSVRRLLEDDLGLPVGGLDAHKQLVGELVDQVPLLSALTQLPLAVGSRQVGLLGLQDGEIIPTTVEALGPAQILAKQELPEEAAQVGSEAVEDGDVGTRSSEVGEDAEPAVVSAGVDVTKAEVVERTGEDDDEDEDEEEDEAAAPMRRRRQQNDGELSSRKQVPMKRKASDGSKETGKRRQAPQPKAKPPAAPRAAYGHEVERLKGLLQSAGMKISPAVYSRVKRADEAERESVLEAELVQLLAKEGLSADASEKDLKRVRKRLDTAKELEGIDTSNIIDEPRGRRRGPSAGLFASLPQRSI
eukprot:SM000036S13341  [mRNA]  locus=s36:764349:766086:+ [translate_table: standard]